MDIEELKFVLLRVDNAVSNTNTKSTLVLGINTFILGGMATNYKVMDSLASTSCVIRIFMYIGILGCLASSLLAVYAIFPLFRHSKSKEEVATGIFFGKISTKTHKEYENYIGSEYYSFEDDIIKQVVEVSKISTEKHNVLRASIISFLIIVVIPWIAILLLTF